MNQATQVPQTKSDAAASLPGTRILHLSDLHFGRNFVDSKWDDVGVVAAALKPQLVVITGDLVETPWRWRLRLARKKLIAFRAVLRQSGGDDALRVLCVPGNHDTRVQGIMPVAWLKWVVLTAVLALGVLWWTFDGTSDLWSWAMGGLSKKSRSVPLGWLILEWTLLGIAVIGIVLRCCVSGNLARAVGADLLLSAPLVIPSLRIGLLPFDSASLDVSWARGRVLLRDMVACKKAMEKAQADAGATRPPFWIATVHHHPLPLPYDDDFEQMMVMDNAGAFLSELSRRGVRLVLHGHKHHQHFARIAIDPSTARRVEVAVLSAGTPTQGRNSLVRRHGFNMLYVDSDQSARIQMYESEGGGTFGPTRSYDMVPLEDQARWSFERDQEIQPLSCKRMVCTADIDKYGDAHFVREFWGVSARRPRVQRLDGELPATAKSGFIEAWRAESRSATGPGIALTTRRVSLGEVHASVLFKSSGLQNQHPPIDFLTEFKANNAFALNRWQFGQMYGGTTDYAEDVQFCTVPGMAIEELVLSVKFSEEIGLPKRVDLRWRERATGQLDGWSPLPIGHLVRMARQSQLLVRIPYPKMDAVYQLNWDLEEDDAAASKDGSDTGAAEALRLRRQLTALLSGEVPDWVREMVTIAENTVREVLHVAHDDQRFDVALFVYDDTTRSLRCLHATYPPGDPRHQSRFAFGLGIAGRAFKASEVVSFVKPHSDTREQPTGYVCGDGTPARTTSHIPEEVILALPLAPLEATDWPYAVLQVSTDAPSRTLTTAALSRDQDVKLLCEALSIALTPALGDILTSLARPPIEESSL